MDAKADIKKYCCAVKEFYFSKDSILVKSLDITPRVIVCKRPLCFHQTYAQSIEVKNKGLHPRSLKYYSHDDDVQVSVCGWPANQYLPPSVSVIVEVYIKPKTLKNINRQRHIYIESEHPNITIDIPIIVLEKQDTPYFPKSIEFPRSIMKTFTYYEFVVYNPTIETETLIIRTLNPCLFFSLESPKIERKDYARVLLKLKVRSLEPLKSSFKGKFGRYQQSIEYIHNPKTVSLYLSTTNLKFEETKFDTDNKKEFTVCNETDNPVKYNFDFENLSKSTIDLSVKSFEGADFKLNITQSFSSFEESAPESIKPNNPKVWDSYKKITQKFYTIEPNHGEFPPNSCTRIRITFHPLIDISNYDDELVPPFKADTKIKLAFMDGELCEKELEIKALITGPEVFMTPKAIDFRQVYLGEEHCERFTFTNTDGIVDCSINFYDYSGIDTCKILITPKEGLYLKPCEQGIFHFTFFTITVGRIFFKIRFKVKNGSFLTVVVKAISKAVQVKPYPDLVEFGTIPIAVPQKRSVLLINPLSVPISLQCYVPDNGIEVPLVLNVDEVDELPPIDIKNPIETIISMQNEENISAYHESDIDDALTRRSAQSNLTYHSMDTDNITECSDTFRREVIEPISGLAWTFVNKIKSKRLDEKQDAEVNILREATNKLLELPYFFELTRYNNYACMDWDTIPSDPKELYYDTEIIHLRPNSGHSLTVLVIPNNVGYFNRAIHIRCCPHVLNSEEEPFDFKNTFEMLCKSELLISKLYVEYNCRIPDIRWNNEISLRDRTIYVRQSYDFEIYFSNESNIGGFVHFSIVPNCTEGAMTFTKSKWKFYVTAEYTITAYCAVEFYRIGNITLTGLVKVVGNTYGVPFHIFAYVLPTRVHIEPREVYKRQNVLETKRTYVYIQNLTPTKTTVIFSLRDERFQSITPQGGQLGPNKQGMYVVIETMAPDPEVIKNILYVDMLFGKKIEVPLTYNIVGMPVFFDPDIKKDYDAGLILLSTKEDYEDRKTNFCRSIRIYNLGERPYMVTFQKLKGTATSTKSQCAADALKAQIYVQPKQIYLIPGGEDFIEISAVACEETTVYNEFRVTITDQTNIMRFANFRFVIRAKFAPIELNWSQKEVVMHYNRTHKYLEHSQIELVKLINPSNTLIDDVYVQVMGPFKIKELYENPFTKELEFKMMPYERKELTILLQKKQLEKDTSLVVKGKIYCFVKKDQQKSLILRANINCPDIVLVESEIILFTTTVEDFTEVFIENVGLLDAQYKWTKLGEYFEYVAENDDILAYSLDLLNDILRMLDLHDHIDPLDDLLCHQNMTLCYQKYRCLIKPPEDTAGVGGIIDEIIGNLDLEHKRYKTELSEIIDDSISRGAWSETASSIKCANETIDKILQHLKLEDSYEFSEPSEEECDKQRHVYFCMKSGTVLAKEGERCMLHMPPVRYGYALKAGFILDVFGGRPQKLLVTLIHLDRIVVLNPESFYLGVKPWYEFCRAKIRINNITRYRLNIEILHPKTDKKNNMHLVHGYADVKSSPIFYLNPFGVDRIKTEGIMGFCEEFIRDLKLRICDRVITTFRIRGQGVMPLLLGTVTSLPRSEQDQYEIIEEYQHLQNIYYFTMFKEIIEEDEELRPCIEEVEGLGESGMQKSLSFSQLSDLSDSDDSAASTGSAKLRRIARNWTLLLSTYVVAYNNSSLPNATILEQLMCMEKFKERLTKYQNLRDILQMVYKDYLKFLCTYDEKMPINLKYFMVQPLPFEQLGYIIEMPDLKLGQFRRYQLDLQFLGPGKLTAAARTAVKIPGLYVHFQVLQKNECEDYEFYRAEEKMPDFYVKVYRNMWERQIDLEVDPKIHHAHSFDCEERCKLHQRKISKATAKNRKDIRNYYNSLNKSVYLENKHHFINCMMYSKSQKNFSGTRIRVHILIRPEAKYYTEGQVIEDNLYIDLHMGPTLPILMRGLIK